jgi:hypothetical protein
MAMSRPITTRAKRTAFASASASISTSEPAPVRPAEVPAPERPVADVGVVAAADPEVERRSRRLGEMVAGLTECGHARATEAVRAILVADPGRDVLDVVARAVIAIEAPEPDGVRIPGYVRPDDPSRRLSAVREARRSRAPRPVALPETGTETGTGSMISGSCDATEWLDDVIFDLRVEHARVRIDLTRLDPGRSRRRP